MKYIGALYARINGKYIEISHSEQFDKQVSQLTSLKKQVETLTSDLKASVESVDHIKEVCDAYQKQNEKLRGVLERQMKPLADKGSILFFNVAEIREALKETEVKW